MLKCANCGNEFDGNVCPRCGTPAPEQAPVQNAAQTEEGTCPICGAKRWGEAKFCAQCGHTYADSKTVEPAAPAQEPAKPVVTQDPEPQQPAQQVYTAQDPNAQGYYQQGYNAQAPNAQQVNQQGYNAQDPNAQGYYQQGYNAQAPNAQQVNQQGYSAQDPNAQGYYQQGYNAQAPNAQQVNQQGYNAQDPNAQGNYQQGYNAQDPNAQYNQQGYNAQAPNAQQVNQQGYNAQDPNAQGYYQQGYNQQQVYNNQPTYQQPTKEIDIIPGRRPFFFYAQMQAKLHRVLLWSSLSLVVVLMAVLPFQLLMMTESYYLVSPHWIVFAAVMTSLVAGVISMVVPVKNWNIEKFRNSVSAKFESDKPLAICSVTKKQFAPWIILIGYGIGLTVGGSLALGFLMRAYLITVIFAVIAFAGFIVASHFVAKFDGGIAAYLFGKARPADNAVPLYWYNEYNQKQAYDAYKKANKANRHAYDDDKTNKGIKKSMLGVICSGGGALVIAIVALILAPVLTNKFSASYVSDMPHDLAPKKVLAYLGEPTEIRYGGESEHPGLNDASAFVYLDGDYEKLYLEAKKIESRMELQVIPSASDLARLETLELKMSTMDYKYLIVYFDKEDSNSYTNKVARIELNQLANDSKELVKTIKEIKFSQNSILQYSDPSMLTFEAEVFYGDGSYRFAPVSGRVFAGVDTSKLGLQAITWDDSWGTTVTSVNVSSRVTSTYTYNKISVDYTIAIVQGGGASDYTVSLAFSNYKSEYGTGYLREFVSKAPWNAYKDMVSSVSFDSSIPSDFVYYISGSDSSYSGMKGWSKLENISVSGVSGYSSADGVLIDTDDHSLVLVPRAKTGEYVVPDSVNSISGGAFGDTSLSEIVIKNSVYRISFNVIGTPVNDLTVYVGAHKSELGSVNSWSSSWIVESSKTSVYYGSPRAGGHPDFDFKTDTYNNMNATPDMPGYTISNSGVVILPTPSCDGYRFIGWGESYDAPTHTVSDLVTGTTYQIKGDSKLYAKWEKIYTVSFNSHNGSDVDEMTVASIETCPVTTRSGYYFQGWYTTSNYSGSPVAFPYTPSQDGTLHARWSSSAYDVTFKTDVSGSIYYSLDNVAYIQSFPEDPTRSGYIFVGWVDADNDDPTDEDAPVISAPTTLSGDVNLVAKWLSPEQFYNGSTIERAIVVTDPTDFTHTINFSNLSTKGVYIKLSVTEDGTYEIRSDCGASSVDPIARLYASNGTTQITSDDDGAGGRDFLIERTLKAGETYYVYASYYGSTKGSYEVTISKSV